MSAPRLLGALALALLGAASAAQVPDTTAAPVALAPADSALVAPAAAPGARRPPSRPLAPPPGPPPGRTLTAVPALTHALTAEELLARAPGAFGYALGTPGRWGGIAWDGLEPSRPALLLGGVPFTDPFTERPRYDLLPVAALDGLRAADVRLGRAGAVEATLRPFRLARPVTELRYLGGGAGVQAASATHAQTRRAPRALGGEAGRLTATVHADTRRANGAFAGGRLRHTQILGRLALLRPGLAADLSVLQTNRAEGARRGVVPVEGDFDSLFDPFRAAIADPNAERTLARRDVALGLAFPSPLQGSEPRELGLYWTAHREAYTPGASQGVPAPTLLGVRGDRVGARAALPLARGPHRLRLRADAFWDGPTRDAEASSEALPRPLRAASRAQGHLALLDSLALGLAALTLEGGAHVVGSEAFASASARLARGAAFAGVRYAHTVPGRIEAAGWGGPLPIAPGPGGAEPVVSAEAGAGLPLGALRVDVRASGLASRPTVLLASTAEAFAFARPAGTVRQARGEGRLSWRPQASEGLYGHLALSTQALVGAGEGDTEQRLAQALPRGQAAFRLGLRGRGLRGGTLDTDVWAEAHAWTRSHGRLVHPPTGLLALPDPALGPALPASGTLDFHAQATLERRVTAFIRIENALARRLYPGALVVPGEPLPAHPLRFGVFWVLLD